MARAKAEGRRSASRAEGPPKADPSKLTPIEMFAIRSVCGDSKCDKVRDRLTERNGQVVDVTVRFSGAMNVPAGGKKLKRQAPDVATLVSVILGAIAPRSRGQVIASVAEQFAGYVAGASADADPGPGNEPEVDAALLAAGQDLLYACTWEGEKFQNGSITGAMAAIVVERK